MQQNSYEADYEAIRLLRDLANETRVAIIVVHHLRKLEAGDPFDTISGTYGLTGAADTMMIITATAQGTILHGRGRDIEGYEKAITSIRQPDIGASKVMPVWSIKASSAARLSKR